MGSDSSHTQTSAFGGTYPPGHALDERYRIVALIGAGGMGEVYLAEDLTLGQEVALKFLPDRMAEHEGALERFRGEVRIARQVSHPNVARVHDIGAVDGRHFLTMEYVDGDDLSQLLKRIGRFPREKAVDVAQQLCAGLIAAHEQGVLHRDLKPANMLVDSDGRLKITDFGLAALAADAAEPGQILGTPAYMSPEQITGREVDERSEVYSLGLVLYELFTGRRAFTGRTLDDFRRLHALQTPSSPSSLITDIDPAVDRVIMRCLAKDPADRPPSVRAVALALPGGDPLAAAVAAGETPGIELVVEAGERGGLSVGLAMGLVALVLAGLIGVLLAQAQVQISHRAPAGSSPEVIAREAREILQDMGQAEEPADHLVQIEPARAYIAWIAEHDDSPHRWDRLQTERPPALVYMYRQGPQTLAASSSNAYAKSLADDPPFNDPGGARLRLDPQGRLLSVCVVPPAQLPPATEDAAPPFDWGLLFTAAGLDMAGFEAVEPEWTPDVAGDARLAWVGPYPGTGWDARVEAASAAGHPVAWRLMLPWDTRPAEPNEVETGFVVVLILFLALLTVLLVGVVVLARRNLGMQRGDRQGAFRLAVFTFATGLLAWILGERHVLSFQELGFVFETLAWSVLLAVLIWLGYLATEPFVRRLWPHQLVSWVRLLDGRVRDPLVGRDLLVGSAAGVLVAAVSALQPIVLERLGQAPDEPHRAQWVELFALQGGGPFLARMTQGLLGGLATTFALTVLLVIFRLLARRQWLGLVLFLPAGLLMLNGPNFQNLPFGLAVLLLWTVTLMRFGLLAATVAMVLSTWLNQLPLHLRTASWLFTPSVLALLVMAGLVAWGFWTSLAGRRILPELEEGSHGPAISPAES